MEEKRVLIASPTYEGMKYCEEKFIKGLKNINYQNSEILLIDNSKTKNYFEHLKKYSGIKVLYNATKEKKNVLRLISSRNIILEYAKEHNFDYIFMIDSDVIPPKEILNELLKCEKGIVTGIYYNLFPQEDTYIWFPVAWRELTNEEFKAIQDKGLYKGVEKSELRKHLTETDMNKKDLIEVSIPCGGCMLISKGIFNKTNYGISKKYFADDLVYFAFQCKEKGIKMFCNTKMVCEHLLEGKFKKDEKGNLIHPFYFDE